MAKPKNIFVIGAQCTGKTTLVDALERHFAQVQAKAHQPTIVREVARTVLQKHNFTRDDIISSPERALQLQQRILEAQFEAETTASNWYICDRSAIDPIVYAFLYASEPSATELFKSSMWGLLERNMKEGLVVVCETGCSWLVDDGTRLMPKDAEDWDRVDAMFRELLEARSIDYLVLPRSVQDLSERVDIILAAHSNSEAEGLQNEAP